MYSLFETIYLSNQLHLHQTSNKTGMLSPD